MMETVVAQTESTPLTALDVDAIRQAATEMLEATQSDRGMQLLAATVLVSAIGLYVTEKDKGGLIRTFGDALWNAWTTVCAVGESGCPPVTPAGRLIGSVLMLLGNPLYDQTKSRIGDILAPLTSSSPPPRRDDELMEKLDLILAALQGSAPR